MRKVLIIFVLCVMLTSCAPATPSGPGSAMSVISTIFPGYDFARQVCGGLADVTMLLPPGTESHTFEPSAQDIIAVKNCDLFVCVGGEADVWVERILDSLDQPVRVLRMIDCVQPVEEEDDHDDSHDDGHGDGEIEYDSHVWTAPLNAAAIVREIMREMCRIDADNADAYTGGGEAYIRELERLDRDFAGFFAGAENKTLLFGDRFPFRYFTDAYGLAHDEAFPGCAADAEASLAVIAGLINRVRQEGVAAVYYIEFSNHKIAGTIAAETGARTAQLHSCHNVTRDEFQNGETYLSLMERNLEVLKETMK